MGKVNLEAPLEFLWSSGSLRSRLKDAALELEKGQGKSGLSFQPHTRLPRAAATRLASAFHLQLPASPISLLGQYSSPGVCLQCFPAQMGSDKANMEAREEVSVIIAQLSSVCEGGGQTIFTEALTFRNLPRCHI